MKPLAYLMRPNTFEDIVGQDHLVGKTGIIKKMLNTNSLFSFILYGNPGCGKTTIAEATCKLSGFKWFKFNASTDNKETLKQIITEASFLDDAIIIVDEIHRMKKDIQDYLLPYVENGTVIMIGLTTVNPYHSVNPAIRSRCHVYRLNDLTSDHLRQVLDRAYKYLDKERIERLWQMILSRNWNTHKLKHHQTHLTTEIPHTISFPLWLSLLVWTGVYLKQTVMNPDRNWKHLTN